MLIAPPELEIFSKTRYIKDLDYREEIDQELASERRLRLSLLFHPEIEEDFEY